MDAIPPSGDQVPLMGLYIIVSTAIAAVNMAMSILLVKIEQLQETTPTHCATVFAKLLKIKKDSKDGVEIESLKTDGLTNDGEVTYNNTVTWRTIGHFLNRVFLCVTILAHVSIIVYVFVIN